MSRGRHSDAWFHYTYFFLSFSTSDQFVSFSIVAGRIWRRMDGKQIELWTSIMLHFYGPLKRIHLIFLVFKLIKIMRGRNS